MVHEVRDLDKGPAYVICATLQGLANQGNNLSFINEMNFESLYPMSRLAKTEKVVFS